MKRYLLPCLILSLFISTSTYAIPYRCNGIVRQRPCSQPGLEDALRQARGSALQSAKKQLKNSPQPGRSDARLEKLSFRKLDSRTGLWSGSVRGSTPVLLTLEIRTPDGQVERREIGQARNLSVSNPVSFNYQSSLPRQPGWTWHISSSTPTKSQ